MKKLILTMFAVLLGVTFICAQSCKDSPVQTEYKTEDSDCGYKTRTCCYDGNWSGWDEACPEPSCGEEQCWDEETTQCVDKIKEEFYIGSGTVWGDKKGLSSGSMCYNQGAAIGQTYNCLTAGEWLGTYQYLPKGDEWKGYNDFSSVEECEKYVANKAKQWESKGYEQIKGSTDTFCTKDSDVGRKGFSEIICTWHTPGDGKYYSDYAFTILECMKIKTFRC